MLTCVNLIAMASILVYLSNKHQRFAKKSMPKVTARIAAVCCLIAALILLSQQFTLSASFVLLVLFTMLACMVIPLLSLFKGKP